MTKTQRILAGAAAALLIAGAGAGAAWYGLRAQVPDPVAEAAAAREEADKHPPKYVSLEKVIVMLRREAGETMSHYMAVDLVFKTGEKTERTTRDHLPMLRSVAVRALSTLTAARAGAMTVDDLAAEVSRAYAETYAAEQREQPFTDVMIGKLIIE